MCKIDGPDNAVALHQSDCLRQRNMSGQQHDSKIRGHEGHRRIFAAREMGKKLGVTGKAIPSQEQSPLVYRGRRDRINTTCRT